MSTSKLQYKLRRDSFKKDEYMDLFHTSYIFKSINDGILRGDDEKVEKFFTHLTIWCHENLDNDDYRLTKTIHNGIRVTLKSEETAMAFRLKWE